jgi:hypothetical protein
MSYLGEFPVDVSTHSVYSKWTVSDWAMLFIARYGSIDGGHHKQWILDQVARILKGTSVDVFEARWTNHEPEVRFRVAEHPSEAYTQWVKDMTSGDNEGYDYDTGIAP